MIARRTDRFAGNRRLARQWAAMRNLDDLVREGALRISVVLDAGNL